MGGGRGEFLHPRRFESIAEAKFAHALGLLPEEGLEHPVNFARCAGPQIGDGPQRRKLAFLLAKLLA